jgi:hypothetical protein
LVAIATTASRHESVNLSLETAVTGHDCGKLGAGQILDANVNVESTLTIDSGASASKRTGNLASSLDSLFSTENRGDNLESARNGRIRDNLPMVATLMVVVFDVARDASGADSLSANAPVNADAFDFDSKRAIRDGHACLAPCLTL